MLLSRTLRTLLLAAASALGAAAPGMAGTYDVHVCDGSGEWTLGIAPTPAPAGAAWSTEAVHGRSPVYPLGQTVGSTPTLACLTFPNSRTSYFGVGGTVSYAISFSTALARFAPPVGARLVAVRGRQNGSFGRSAAIGVFTSTGRYLGEPVTIPFVGARDAAPTVGLDETQLGRDGSAGVAFGVRCAEDLDSYSVGCSGLYGFGGTLTLADDSAPDVVISSVEVVDGAALISWRAKDEQAGIARVRVSAGGSVVSIVDGSCLAGAAPACSVAIERVTRVPLEPGVRTPVEVTATTAAGDEAVGRVVVADTRPMRIQADAPRLPSTGAGRPQPDGAPSVSLQVRHKRRSLVLSGAATGCTTVSLTFPGRRLLRIPVRQGTWAATVKNRAGRYAAACGTAVAIWRLR